MKFDQVFEGGGAKGIVFAGALEEMAARGHTPGRLIGTSAGAITATFVAAGYSPSEILEAVNEKLPDGKPRFSGFMDVPAKFTKEAVEESLLFRVFQAVDLPFVPGWLEDQIDYRVFAALMGIPALRQYFSFVELGGIFAGDKFIEWLKEKLDADNRNLGSTTLIEFHERTGKDLSVVASNTTAGEMIVLNHRTAPDCPIIWAVRMSMSIPFVWQEVVWKSEWGQYRGRSIEGHSIVDGGVLSNFPIELFISSDQDVVGIMGLTEGSEGILGFLIDEKLPVANAVPLPPTPVNKLLGDQIDFESRWFITFHRVTNLINTMMSGRDNQAVFQHKDRVCRLPAKGYGTTEFDMSNERIEALVAAGRTAAKAYFDAHSFGS